MGEMLAAMYDPLIAPFDWFGVRQWREWVVGAARGRVLEIGVGTGLNLLRYRAAQTIAAIDPDGASLRRARTRRNGGAISLHQARAEELPFVDAAFDAVLATFVFCSVGEPTRALAETRRVLKPGGTLRLVEHVRVSNRLVAGAQDAITPLWKELAGGCHLNRDTLAAVERAGFRVRAVKRLIGGLFIGIDATR